MRKVLSKLGLEPGPRIQELIQLGAALQQHRAGLEGPGRSATRRLTRSTALYAIRLLDEQIEQLLAGRGMDWARFGEMLGIESPPEPVEQADVSLADNLRAAVTRLAEERPELRLQVLDLLELTLAILDSVLDQPSAGLLPERLEKLGLDSEQARADLVFVLGLSEEHPAAAAGSRREGEEPRLVYLGYGLDDSSWAARVGASFGPYREAGLIRLWSEHEVSSGIERDVKIAAEMAKAAAAVLLVSPAFLGSGSAKMVSRLLARRDEGLRIFSLLLEPVEWKEGGWLARTQVFPPTLTVPLAEHPEEAITNLLDRFAREVIVLTGWGARSPAREKKPGTVGKRGTVGKKETVGRKGLTGASRVPTHADDPSEIDLLNRRPFAEVIAIRIAELRDPPADAGDKATGDEGSFAVHLHGPWGAGKTSVLNFIREELESGRRGRRWVTVVFDAWRHQRLRPPWWSLIRQVYRQSLRRLKEMAGEKPPGEASAAREHRARRRRLRRTIRRLRWRWFKWRFRADLMPILVALGLLVAAAAVVVWYPGQGMKVAATLLAAGAGAFAFGRSLLFGSARAAETYMSMSRDPMGPIGSLFEGVVDAFSEHPLAIFIDDLDRCDSDYVVELLEGIQTLFRDARVTYVVLADRKWIRSSFEQRYPGFSGDIAEPGRPLGYLFLEKVFQISAPLPRLSGNSRVEFWDHLLRMSGKKDVKTLRAEVEKAEREAEELLVGEPNREGMQRVLKQHQEKPKSERNPLLIQGLRAVVAKRLSSQTQQARTAHYLQPFAPLLEPNPRAMKRLVNAYGIYQAVNILEGREVDRGALALWCILEMRWPLLADCIADSPGLVSEVGQPRSKNGRVPDHLADLFASPRVSRVVDPKKADEKLEEKDRLNIDARLTPAEVRLIVGSWAEAQQLTAERSHGAP